MRQHYRELDGLRACAALAVVMIHVSSGLASDVQIVCNQLARFAVPGFFLLSGFGAAGKTTYQGFGRRMARILPPYVLWSVIYMALDALCGRPHAAPLHDLLSGTTYMHLYFLFVLVQFEVLRPWLARAVEKFPRASLAIAAAVSAVCQVWTGLSMLQKLPPARLAGVFCPYLLFYVTGLWLRPRYESLRRRTPARVAGAVALWAMSTALVLWASTRYAPLRGSSLRLDLAVYTLSTVWLFVQCWPRERLHPLRRIAGAVSALSFALYLAHPLVMRLLGEWAARYRPGFYWPFPWLYVLTAAGGILLAWLLGKLPFGALLGGNRRKKEKIPPKEGAT